MGAVGMTGIRAADEARVGAELLGYAIEALIGRGGMGVVYRAHDPRLKRKVALKLLAAELAADPGFRERFLRESELAASLDHPNVIPIYEAGEADDLLFIAMRYVDGSDLKQRLAEGRLLPAVAVELAEQIAGALDAAHASGLVHRDVKPSNVLIAPGAGTHGSDHVYLSDFGLTRRLVDSEHATAAEPLMATLDYVAPEQIRGEEVDGRADVYSFGCLLYECLAGEPPFRASSDAALLYAHLEQEPPRLSERGFPEAVDPVIERALAKDPEERYPTARELVEAAREALGIAAPAAHPWWRAPALLGLTGIALIAVGVAAFLLVRGTAGMPPLPGADSLLRIDPVSDKVTATIPVGRKASGLAADARYVWVANEEDRTVWRIDPKTRKVLVLPAHGIPTGIAVGGGKAVVADDPEHSVAWFDSATGAFSDTVTLPGGTYYQALPVAGGGEGVWFADPAQGIVGKVDDLLSSGAPTDQAGIPPDKRSLLSTYRSFDGFAVGEGALWVAGDPFGRTVWRVDPRTKRVVATIRLPFVPKAIAVGEGAVWVTSLLDDTVSRIDPATNRIISTIRVGLGPDAVAAGGGAVWVTSSIDDTVSRIDPSTNRVVATIPIAGTPGDIAVGAGGVWVTTAKPAAAPPKNIIKIGVLSDCISSLTVIYDLNLAGAELALIQRGGKPAGPALTDGVDGVSVGGRPVRLFFGCADGTTASALVQARRLVEKVGVDVLIGPFASNDEPALQEYARRHPRITFVNGGASGAQLLSPAPNFFSFTPDGGHVMAGLGSYAYRTLGWRTAALVTMSGDLGLWAQSAGFAAEFCSLGGTIAKRVWILPDATDLSGLSSQIPRSGIDGIVVVSLAPDAVLTLANSYAGLRRNISRKMIVGYWVAATGAAPNLLKLGARVSGIVTGGSTYPNSIGDPPDPGLAYNGKYMTDFRKAYPRIPKYLPGGWFDVYWYDPMAATLKALDTVHGDLSDGESRLMAALAEVKLAAPNGLVRLDAKHQPIAPNYVFQLYREGHSLHERVIRTIPSVEQTFGGYFTNNDPPPSESTPVCRRGHVPPWARSS